MLISTSKEQALELAERYARLLIKSHLGTEDVTGQDLTYLHNMLHFAAEDAAKEQSKGGFRKLVQQLQSDASA